MSIEIEVTKDGGFNAYIGIVEIGDSVFTIEKIGNNLTASTVCNAGLICHYSQKYDNDFSLDENIQGFIEEIEMVNAE